MPSNLVLQFFLILKFVQICLISTKFRSFTIQLGEQYDRAAESAAKPGGKHWEFGRTAELSEWSEKSEVIE